MPRKEPARRAYIAESICKDLELEMSKLLRDEDLSPFIEWICRLWIAGQRGEIRATRVKEIRDERDDRQRKTG